MGAAEQVRTVVESLEALLEGHVRLFKLELAEDARVIGVQVGTIAALLPLLVVGYAFVCVALAMLLGRYLWPELAALLVGLVNLGAGALGIARAASRLGRHRVLEGTRREAAATTAAISRAVLDPSVTVEVTRG